MPMIVEDYAAIAAALARLEEDQNNPGTTARPSTSELLEFTEEDIIALTAA
jgi:hypothetical protein